MQGVGFFRGRLVQGVGLARAGDRLLGGGGGGGRLVQEVGFFRGWLCKG